MFNLSRSHTKLQTVLQLVLILVLLLVITTPALAMAPGSTDPPQPPISPLVQMFIEVAGLSAFLFALVAWLKDYGLAGKALTLSSLIGGMVIGFLVRYASAPPVTVGEWIWAFLYGLLCGFVASGAYKGGKGIAGTDEAGTAAALKANNVQTAKIIKAVDAGPEKQTPQ